MAEASRPRPRHRNKVKKQRVLSSDAPTDEITSVKEENIDAVINDTSKDEETGANKEQFGKSTLSPYCANEEVNVSPEVLKPTEKPENESCTDSVNPNSEKNVQAMSSEEPVTLSADTPICRPQEATPEIVDITKAQVSDPCQVSSETFSPSAEDPDTASARECSPSVMSSERAAFLYSPPNVQEEKSPSLLAQEALAKLQLLTVKSGGDSVEAAVAQQDRGSSILESENHQVLREPQEMLAEASATEAKDLTQTDLAETAAPSVDTQLKRPFAQLSQQLQHMQRVEESKNKIKAESMPLSELLTLYHNPELIRNDAFVENFVQNEMKKNGHEFVEILLNYFRARHQLIGVEEDIRELQKKYAELQEMWWIIHTKNTVATGQCSDRSNVSVTHQYFQRELNKEAVEATSKTLQNIRDNIATNLCLYAYTAQLSKLQVESYIHNLYTDCPRICEIPKNAGIQARSTTDTSDAWQIQRFKECISILFMFHRKPTADSEFTESIRKWTIRLISSLLRVATFEDHLFVLNHILRCPAGVGKWAVELVQCPVCPISAPVALQSGVSNAGLDHIVVALATVLMPIKAREEFMSQMRINVSETSLQLERNWILVDSDGEEDEDPSNSWLYLHENDIVNILGQFPLKQVFTPILLASLSDSGVVDYDISRSTEPMMIRLFAFSTMLIQVLGEGLTTYSMARYRQLNKRLGRLIRQTVSFISDHWLNFKSHYGPLMAPASIDSLQAEFDQLFMRATYKILTAQKLGSWQFMADMPYTMVSLGSLWQLLWVLHQAHGQVVNLDSLPSVEECKSYLQDPDSWQQLADNLLHTNTSESIYLLTTFANMAGCRSSDETDFIRTITLEVFEIAYICNHTREFCSKVGRELLSSIIQTHPVALSFLLNRVSSMMDKLGRMAFYLFSELPISVWQPTDPDLLILRQWLLNFSLGTLENKLSQMILAKINWDVFEQTGRLVVDMRHHRHVALLLVEAYAKYISDKRAGFFIMEGMRQMSSYLATGTSAEQSFNNWAWELALRLKIHQQSVLLHSPGAVDLNFQSPVLGSDAWLVPLVKEVTQKSPIGCFVALTMTNVGHEVTSFISEGLDLLAVLTSNYQYTSAIHILGCVVPLFIDCEQYLLENVVFIQVVQAIAVADESLFKSTRSAIMKVEFPGIVTAQFAEMIQAQITSHLSLGKAEAVIGFWLKVIFKVCKDFTCRNCCYVADTVLRWCFVKKGVVDLISDIFKEHYQKFCAAAKNSQRMFSWFGSNNTLPSFMDSSSLPEFPWLAYMILYVEGEAEVYSQLWQTLVQELHSPSRFSVDHALKLAVGKLSLEQTPSVGRLVIYRWAQQALDTPFDHPLLPVMWQRFFALYLGRQIFDSSMGQRASVGERFFESMTYSGMLRRMRKRLFETSSFHMNFDPQTREIPRRQNSLSPGTPPVARLDDQTYENEASGAAAATQEDSLEYTSSKEFHQMLAHLYQTYSLWLEEPRLHDANLYLPALPPQYEAVRLNQVFQGFMGPWLEFVDLDGIQYNLSCLAADWRKRLTGAATAVKLHRRETTAEPENATQRIIRRLGRYDTPKPPPPLQTIQSPVTPINPTILHDQDALVHLIRADLDIITRFTKIFSTRQAQHCALDNTFIELIPQLYMNVAKTVTLTAPCKSKVNPLHRCTNPAVLPVKIYEAEIQEQPRRQMDENRVEYKQVMIEALLPTPPNFVMAVVHTENAITMLIKQSQQQDNRSKFNPTACLLFFTMTEMVCEDTNLYPPSKQFFTSCIEVLGQHFVSHDPDQVSSVLQLCLDRPHVAGLASPHFVPNICSNRCLLDMYGQLVHVLRPNTVDLVVMLLSKFDIAKWLSTARPTDGERKRLVETLGSAMMACGAELSQNIGMVFGIYLVHLKEILSSNFPANLYSVFDMILQGSANEQLSTQVWEIFLQTCFSDVLVLEAAATEEGNTQDSDGSTKVKCVDMRLSTAQVKELLDWLSSYFMHVRMSDKHATNFGLMVKWSRYVSYISFLIRSLIRGYVAKVITGSGDMNPYHVMELLWQPLVGVFSPWIQPIATSSDIIVYPWLEADDTLAIVIVQAFKEAVLFVYNEMNKSWAGSGSGVLALLLMYYLTCLSTKSTPDNVANVLTSELGRLPWQYLRPDIQLLETMTQVREVASPACFSLVSVVMLKIEWLAVLKDFRYNQHPDLASRAELSVAVLLIQGHVHPLFGQNEDLSRLLLEAITYEWSLVGQEGFTCVCSWFLQLCDPHCVLAERSSNLALGLRLLKRIAGFHTEVTWDPIVSFKRQSYIHCLVQQLCQLTYKTAGVNEEQFSTVLMNLMSDIEAVECTVTDMVSQQDESAALIKEVLSLLNNSNPNGPWLGLVETSVTAFLHESPHSLLLLPCIRASSQALASLAHMAAVMEAALEAYFAGVDPVSQLSWPYLLSVFQVPQLNQAGYVEESLSRNAFLMLYAYLRHQKQQDMGSSGMAEGSKDLQLMKQVLDWTGKAEPGSEDDAKLVLWWHFLLQMITDQICSSFRPGSIPITGIVNILQRFVELMGQIGQDRAGKGLLAAIGLGRRSTVSPRMRILARALAAFLSLRISSPDKLHVDQTALKFPFSTNTNYGGELLSLRRNKSYSQYTEAVEEAVALSQNPSQTVFHVVPLLQRLVMRLFPDKNFLRDIVIQQ
ncbi:ectopic p granules protein 5 homolog [Plakobranchus ocellatus]|uniref:Ectopic p granules protein 5 homolog n=1 Tax=Plakobranchus ocellatus TaxID=259542 RepID=A0AAV4BNS7_9GAST|nr:ectopic p granules protein 5 homolog [Plakobranchus ocellatus]